MCEEEMSKAVVACFLLTQLYLFVSFCNQCKLCSDIHLAAQTLDLF